MKMMSVTNEVTGKMILEVEYWDKDEVAKSSEAMNMIKCLEEENESIDFTKSDIPKIIIFGDKMYSAESVYKSTFPWYRGTKKDFKVYTTNQFTADWKLTTKTDFNDNNVLYNKLKNFIKGTCDAGIAYPKSKESGFSARKCEVALSSSGRGKKNDARVYFGVFPIHCAIYFVSIASQKEHHADQKDTKAVERADAELKRISLGIKEKLI
jgi:hypothetical protein